ncbi:MAG: VanZ family protein [Nitrospira sp.]|nr:VanZ family protein [Nitrospira sp.]
MVTLLRYWGPVCGYAALIFYLSSQPHPETHVPFVTLFSDKVLHVVEYAVLGALCYRAIRGSGNASWRQQAIPAAILLTSLYGVSDEVHQAFVPFRDSSWLDWLADTIGAVVGVVGINRFSPWGFSGDQQESDPESLLNAACTASKDRKA